MHIAHSITHLGKKNRTNIKFKWNFSLSLSFFLALFAVMSSSSQCIEPEMYFVYI